MDLTLILLNSSFFANISVILCNMLKINLNDKLIIAGDQCWASYLKNVIYYSLLVLLSKVILLLYLLLSGNSN